MVTDGLKKWSGRVRRKQCSSIGQHGNRGVTTQELFSFCQVFHKDQGSGKFYERIWGKWIKKVDKVDMLSQNEDYKINFIRYMFTCSYLNEEIVRS